MQPVVQQLQEVEGMCFNSWYLDDCTLIRTYEVMQEAWDLPVAEGSARVLHLSRQ